MEKYHSIILIATILSVNVVMVLGAYKVGQLFKNKEKGTSIASLTLFLLQVLFVVIYVMCIDYARWKKIKLISIEDLFGFLFMLNILVFIAKLFKTKFQSLLNGSFGYSLFLLLCICFFKKIEPPLVYIVVFVFYLYSLRTVIYSTYTESVEKRDEKTDEDTAEAIGAIAGSILIALCIIFLYFVLKISKNTILCSVLAIIGGIITYYKWIRIKKYRIYLENPKYEYYENMLLQGTIEIKGNYIEKAVEIVSGGGHYKHQTQSGERDRRYAEANNPYIPPFHYILVERRHKYQGVASKIKFLYIIILAIIIDIIFWNIGSDVKPKETLADTQTKIETTQKVTENAEKHFSSDRIQPWDLVGKSYQQMTETHLKDNFLWLKEYYKEEAEKYQTTFDEKEFITQFYNDGYIGDYNGNKYYVATVYKEGVYHYLIFRKDDIILDVLDLSVEHQKAGGGCFYGVNNQFYRNEEMDKEIIGIGNCIEEGNVDLLNTWRASKEMGKIISIPITGITLHIEYSPD